MPAGDEFRVEFDPAQFKGFVNAVKAFEPALATAMRRNLRRAGDDTIRDMRDRVTSGRPGSVRAGIAAGLKTSVTTAKRHQGVRITGTSARIPEGHKPMLRLYNKKSFRHPVFGSDTWAVQQGRPFFGSTIAKHEDEMVEAIMNALTEAFVKMAATR